MVAYFAEITEVEISDSVFRNCVILVGLYHFRCTFCQNLKIKSVDILVEFWPIFVKLHDIWTLQATSEYTQGFNNGTEKEKRWYGGFTPSLRSWQQPLRGQCQPNLDSYGLGKILRVDTLPSTVPTYVPTFLNCTYYFLRFSYTIHYYCTISSGPFADDSNDWQEFKNLPTSNI